MTREYLESIKAKPHGPDVAKLIAEIERCWSLTDWSIQDRQPKEPQGE